MNSLEDAILKKSIWQAGLNWVVWREDYANDAGIDWLERPLMKSEKRFHRFCNEYKLSRNIRHKDNKKGNTPTSADPEANSRKARKSVHDFFRMNPPDPDTSIDDLTENLGNHLVKLRDIFGEAKDNRGPKLTSLCSKVLCFYDPVRFTPYDRLARFGAKKMCTDKSYRSAPYTSYKEYKSDFDGLLELHSGKIEKIIANFKGFDLPKEKKTARVLDCYLMNLGSQVVGRNSENE